MSGRFKGKVAVVTGGANGIGRASALRFAEEGADVAILDIEPGPLEESAGRVLATGRRVLALPLDLTDIVAAEAAFATIRDKLGPVDVLLNNVGQTARERATEFWCSEPHIWDFVIRVSLMTTLNCSRQVVPEMRARKVGRIVSIASDSALIGDEQVADYAAAKAGVIGFTRSLARELAPFKINVNAIAPGLLDRYLGKTGFKSQQRKQKQASDAPVNLWEPADGPAGKDFGAHGIFDSKATQGKGQLWASHHHGVLAAGVGTLTAAAALVLGRRR